jgi:hypothetical protein
MNEHLLQFIWGQGLFDVHDLRTTEGDTLQLMERGHWNHDQGPDFLSARLRIGKTTWAGQVELHVRSSDWVLHKHDGDPHYRNVVLHVVWEHDRAVNAIPVLELKDRVRHVLLEQYQAWSKMGDSLPCRGEWERLGLQPGKGWLASLVRQRLDRKAMEWIGLLKACGNDWEELCWRRTAQAFGGLHNGDVFARMASALGWRTVVKHRENIIQLESLILGQAGCLQDPPSDQYSGLLLLEYRFLAAKYRLPPPAGPLVFFRLRPGSFPDLRLAQLSMFVHDNVHLFAALRDASEPEEWVKSFKVTPNDYWHYHYRLGEESAYAEKPVGEDMARGLVINMAVPTLYTAGRIGREEHLMEKALQWLDQLPAEDNRITRGFSGLNTGMDSALGSQALLELEKHHCSPRRCLECQIGRFILQRNAAGEPLKDNGQATD